MHTHTQLGPLAIRDYYQLTFTIISIIIPHSVASIQRKPIPWHAHSRRLPRLADDAFQVPDQIINSYIGRNTLCNIFTPSR